MTLQEIFNKSATHLLTQRRPAYGPNGGVAYRGRGGDMCAIGCLIPDELYRLDLEGRRFCAPPVAPTLAAAGVLPSGLLDELGYVQPSEVTLLLDTLQRLHDRFIPTIWPDALAQVAKQFDLEMPHAAHSDV